MKKLKTEISKPKIILILILLFTFFSRAYRIDYPKAFVFDEVYHAFTAQEYVKGNKDAWNPWATPPKGVAFEWTHPPLAKEIMAESLFLTHSFDSWAWRLPGVLLGVACVYLVYLLGIALFKDQTIGLLSALIFSLDGLNFVQSRTGMNDIYFLAFSLTSLYLMLKNKFFFSAVALGLAISSKWTGIYLIPLLFILLYFKKQLWKIPIFIIFSALIYLLTYIPYFLQGYNLNQFIELQKQMWGYHTNLKATHVYASPWWSWPLNLYPVWYFVDYTNGKIANIFASGNPIIFWTGTAAVLMTIWDFWKKRAENLFIVLAGYFIFFLPWAFSPRIMFLYHYLPSTPFMTLALGYQMRQILQSRRGKIQFWIILGLIVLGFIFIYPFITGIPLPRNLMELFFLTNLTKNPF